MLHNFIGDNSLKKGIAAYLDSEIDRLVWIHLVSIYKTLLFIKPSVFCLLYVIEFAIKTILTHPVIETVL